MTRDLDLAVRGLDEAAGDTAQLLGAAADARFAVSEPKQLAPGELGGRGWRFHVDARLAAFSAPGRR